MSRRLEVALLTGNFEVSERRACELLGVDRSSCRYRARPRRDEELRHALTELAHRRPRFGYRRLTALLRRKGHRVNPKRIWRLCVELRLSVRWKKRKRLLQAAQPPARASRVNEEWGMDFIHDWAASGQRLRALTIVDVYSRVSPAVEVGTSIGSQRVTRVLERAGKVHGFPRRIRSDNGPEFRSRQFHSWCEERGIEVIHIQPGKPTQNAAIESFNGRLREECLNANWFQNVNDARAKIVAWKEDYNHRRPHSSLGYRTPEEFAALSRAACQSIADVEEGVSNANPFLHASIPAESRAQNGS